MYCSFLVTAQPHKIIHLSNSTLALYFYFSRFEFICINNHKFIAVTSVIIFPIIMTPITTISTLNSQNTLTVCWQSLFLKKQTMNCFVLLFGELYCCSLWWSLGLLDHERLSRNHQNCINTLMFYIHAYQGMKTLILSLMERFHWFEG